jgi:hypothetical protein
MNGMSYFNYADQLELASFSFGIGIKLVYDIHPSSLVVWVFSNRRAPDRYIMIPKKS